MSKTKIRSLDDMIPATNILLKFGVKNILIKGGHRNTRTMQDVLLNKKELKIFKIKKLKQKTHMELDAPYQVQSQHFLLVEKI